MSFDSNNKGFKNFAIKATNKLKRTIMPEKYGIVNKKVWLFNSGNIFAGNPKWLFVYINKYRKDIEAVWLCDNEDTVDYIKKLGYKAYVYACEEAYDLEVKASVYVVENVKESIPVRLNPNAKILNLFHGVGCKSIERKVDYGFLFEKIARKYIKYNTVYKNNQLFLVTSPLMEEHFKEQCGIDDDMVIRAGYPRCEYQKYFDKIETFNHNILEENGMPSDGKIAVYAPTYRDSDPFDFFGKAIPDMNRLLEKLKKHNMMLIFKIHPLMERDSVYNQVKEYYKDCPNFLFWDNSKDFYEVMDKVDLAIVDYSSIYYDLLAAGVKNFVRYIFDYGEENTIRDLVFDLIEMTSGKICKSFDELLDSFDYKNTKEDEADTERINGLFWQYAGKDTFDRIIEQTEKFSVKKRELPNLYSFDIFDTLISRKVLNPVGIFYKVKEKMELSGEDFPKILVEKYPGIRHQAERNVRDFYIKTLQLREDERREITFDEIFDRIQCVYGISDEQKELLKEWELEAEYEDSIPLEEKIGFVEELVEQGEEVVLISDMYLPKEFIKKLLYKANPLLAELPLFLSSDLGVQKTTKKLYLEVYKSYPEYGFGSWFHFGDSQLADGTRPRQLAITAAVHQIPEFNQYEQTLVDTLKTYDSYLVAAKLARFRDDNPSVKDYYAYAYVSTYMAPYVSYAVKDAAKRGTKCLYFISRDGYHLKRIADEIIRIKGFDIKTKYIYGSRRVWRIPSFIDEIDSEFFSTFGNFALIDSYENLVKSTCMTEEEFENMFPELVYLKNEPRIDLQTMKDVVVVLSNSEKYREFVLDYAEKERTIVEDYLRQEIDFNEPFAFVEYWGRGYTQECHTRLMQHTAGREIDVPYYYIRSIYPTQGHNIRYNYTTHIQSLIFVEAIFANLHYKTVKKYEYKDGRVVPVIEHIECDEELNDALKRQLKQFCIDFYEEHYDDEDTLERMLFDFSFTYYSEHQEDDLVFSECLGHLIDSPGTYGDKREFAPALNEDMLKLIEEGVPLGRLTSSVPITLNRSCEKDKAEYERLTVTVVENLKQEKKLLRKKDKSDVKEIKFKKILQSYNSQALKYNRIYSVYRQEPVVKNSVLFIYPLDGSSIKSEYWSLYHELTSRKDIIVNFLTKAKKYTEKDIKLIASSEVILVRGDFELVSMLKLRPETKLVQLGTCAFPYAKFGGNLSAADAGPYEREYNKKLHSASYSVIPAASEEIAELFKKSYKNTNPANILPIGSPSTDIYFSSEYKNEGYKKLYDIMPQAKGKKIIVYIPRNRYRAEPYKKLEFLDISKMFKYLKDDYVLVYHSQASLEKKYHVSNRQKSFAINIYGQIPLRQILSVADIVVGDYRDSFFEAPLLGKPIFATARDFDTFAEGRELSYDYKTEVAAGPIVADTMDLINRIIDIDNYDFSAAEKVRNRFLSACDGNSAGRLIDILFKS